MDIKILLSYTILMLQNIIILLIYFQPFKNAKTICNLEATRKTAEEGGAQRFDGHCCGQDVLGQAFPDGSGEDAQWTIKWESVTWDFGWENRRGIECPPHLRCHSSDASLAWPEVLPAFAVSGEVMRFSFGIWHWEKFFRESEQNTWNWNWSRKSNICLFSCGLSIDVIMSLELCPLLSLSLSHCNTLVQVVWR